jgi:phosphoribosylanthranilate isomerase
LSNIWIKICGITRPQDAQAAAALAVDAIGVVFYPPSSRAVELAQVAEIVAELSSSVKVTALFVDPEPALVTKVCDSGLVQQLQFHGAEPADFCASFGLPYLKALRVRDSSQLASGELLEQLQSFATAQLILLDSFDADSAGGSGKRFDWSIAESVNAQTNVNLVVAGGLNPGNVMQAIRQVNPFGVDVSTGVEQSPGIKDLSKMKKFVEGARSA